MEREAKAIAMTIAIDRGVWKGIIWKGIAGRNSSIPIDPQDFSSERTQALCVILYRVLSHKNIQHSIGTEIDDPSVMILCSRNVVKNHLGQGAGCHGIPARRRSRKTYDAIDRAACSVEHIYEAVLDETRIDCNTEQAFLIPGYNRERGKRCGL